LYTINKDNAKNTIDPIADAKVTVLAMNDIKKLITDIIPKLIIQILLHLIIPIIVIIKAIEYTVVKRMYPVLIADCGCVSFNLLLRKYDITPIIPPNKLNISMIFIQVLRSFFISIILPPY
jgi:hypothetical protein